MRSTALTTALVLVLLVTCVAVSLAALFCAQCGAKLPEGAKFCPNCGAKVEQGDAGAVATRPRAQQRCQGIFTTTLYIFSFLPDGMTQGSDAGNAWQRKFLQTLKACGFNAIAGNVPLQMIDMAEEMSMYVLYDSSQDIRAALDKQGLDTAGCQKALEPLASVCRQHKNVLAGFMITDPVNPAWADNWRLLGGVWNGLQPDVPLLASFWDVPQWQRFDATAPVSAITGWSYIFKVGSNPDLLPSPACFGPKCQDIRRADPRVPVWSWINTWGPIDEFRWPTMAEYQALHWALLAEGVRGAIYQAYAKPKNPGDPLVTLADAHNEPRPIMFELKPMILEFARMGSELLDYAIDDALVKNVDGPVEASIYVNNMDPKKRYLVLANRNLGQVEATTVSFDPGGQQVKQLRDFADGSVVPVREQGGLIVCGVRLEPASGRMLEIVGG